ncbi:MAG: response regulator transcription factor [Rhodobacteraceae bacterium]|nr:response regulator transcription factor [Paracoccaceae bacterium]
MSVVLVEDNVQLRDSIADFLAVDGFDVTTVGSAVELYQVITEKQFSVAVVDINLPYHDGFAITRYLAREQLCAVIITSVRDSIEDRVEGYRSGADIYMVKPVQPQELSAAIERLQKKERTIEPQSKPDTQSWLLDAEKLCLWTPNNKVISLSRREALVLGCLLDANGAVVSRSTLQTLLEEADEAHRGRLDTLLSRLRQKIRREAGVEIPIVTLHNAGYSFPPAGQ